jgi:hypothetical protein
MVKKHAGPQHWVAVKTMYIPDSVSNSACRSVLSPIFIHSANLVDEKSSGVSSMESGMHKHQKEVVLLQEKKKKQNVTDLTRR